MYFEKIFLKHRIIVGSLQWSLISEFDWQMSDKQCCVYRQVSNIRRTLVGNWIVDHSDVVGASPVGAAPTTSSFST